MMSSSIQIAACRLSFAPLALFVSWSNDSSAVIHTRCCLLVNNVALLVVHLLWDVQECFR